MVNDSAIQKIVGVSIGMVVVFLILAALYPTMATAGDNLNTSGFPLGSIFVGGGVVFVLLAAGVLFAIMKALKGAK